MTLPDGVIESRHDARDRETDQHLTANDEPGRRSDHVEVHERRAGAHDGDDRHVHADEQPRPALEPNPATRRGEPLVQRANERVVTGGCAVLLVAGADVKRRPALQHELSDAAVWARSTRPTTSRPIR